MPRIVDLAVILEFQLLKSKVYISDVNMSVEDVNPEEDVIVEPGQFKLYKRRWLVLGNSKGVSMEDFFHLIIGSMLTRMVNS